MLLKSVEITGKSLDFTWLSDVVWGMGKRLGKRRLHEKVWRVSHRKYFGIIILARLFKDVSSKQFVNISEPCCHASFMPPGVVMTKLYVM